MATELIDRPATEPEAEPRPAPARRRLHGHRLILAAYLVTGFALMGGIWLDPAGRHHIDNPGDDQVLFEWMLSHTAHLLTNGGGNPLFSALLNVPDGANLMANTSVIAFGVLLAPVTLTLGAPVSYALAMSLGLFGTAAAWYYLMYRHLKLARGAAAVGAALCAFGPSTIAHANGHLNFTALFLVPLIIIAILRLAEPGRAVRGGLVLGSLLIVQLFIGEEVVFLLALFMAVFVAIYAVLEWQTVKPLIPRYLKGLIVAGLLAVAVMAYPLWFQFFGPQAYASIPWPASEFPADLASFTAFPTDSLAGRVQLPNLRLRHNVTEENTFFGLPLVALTVVLAIWLYRRHRALRAVGFTAVFFALLSLGVELRINGNHTGIPGPYELFSALPLFGHTIPTRFALVLLPVVALIVAFGLDRVIKMDKPARPGWYLAFAIALVPLIPLPPNTEAREPVPDYIADGGWREHVSEGGTLIPVPIPERVTYDGQRWQMAADFGFGVPLGAFIGPDEDGDGRWSGIPTPTAEIIMEIMDTGDVPTVTDALREQAEVDFRYWRAEAVVLGPHEYRWALSAFLTMLLGPGEQIDDVTVWQINPDTGEVVAAR